MMNKRVENCKTILFERLIYLTVWMIIMSIPFLTEMFRYAVGQKFNWELVWKWWIAALPFLILFLIHNYLLIPRYLFARKLKTYIVGVLLSVAAFSVSNYIVFKHNEEPRRMMVAENIDRPPGPPRHHLIPMPVVMDTALMLLMFGANLAVVLLFKYYRDEDERIMLDSAHLQEEIKYLKSQLNPHFFMNMLNNIHSMVEINPAKAQDMILELSHLMRYVLYDGDSQVTTLEKEVHFVENYVALMRKRYSDTKVKISLETPPCPSSEVFLPPLIFISFIENAFKHGISYRSRSEIDVKVEYLDGQIRFFCRNTKPLQSYRQNHRAGGVGLDNVKRRLDLIYRENHSLTIDDLPDSYSITLIIPCL